MSKPGSTRPSPATLVAAIALAFALISTAFAADPVAKLNPKKVRKIAQREIDKRAPGLSVANATNATNATNAADAANLGGLPPSAYAGSAIEPYHAIGQPGEAAFQNGWTNTPGYATAAFAKDTLGVVHLRGAIDGTGGSVAFTLPPGYRPADNLLPVGVAGGPTAAIVEIQPDGDVSPSCNPASACSVAVGLDAITFIADR